MENINNHNSLSSEDAAKLKKVYDQHEDMQKIANALNQEDVQVTDFGDVIPNTESKK